MLFNSLSFVAFFATFFVLYWSVFRHKVGVQNIWLLVGSLFFYGCWDWRFLGLIALIIASTYTTALLAERRNPRLWTALNIVLCLSVLCLFKYLNFFGDSLVWLMQQMGLEVDWFTLDVLLPVGVSFYTFQAVGYSVDVCRRTVRAERNPVNFAVFICYFPQLVAGPIERAAKLLPQISRPRRWDRGDIVEGMRQALWGLVKKVVIADACADRCAVVFDRPLDSLTSLGTLSVTFAVIMFSVQIYCDFSGYCDMARGVSRCLGIDLTQNFRYPYFARNVQEFWRRWNVSLMQWFRDYVYIPLGGSRRGAWHTYANIFIVFLLSGLWHGASWCFVLWGAYWGIIMVAYRLIDRNTRRLSLPEGAGIAITCCLAVIGWVIFRSESIVQAYTITACALPYLIALTAVICCVSWLLSRLPSLASLGSRLSPLLPLPSRLLPLGSRLPSLASPLLPLALLYLCCSLWPVEMASHYLRVFIVVLFVVEWSRRRYDFALSHPGKYAMARVGVYWLLILLVLTNCMEEIPFIYFQF